MAEHNSIAETFCFSSGSAPVIAQNYIWAMDMMKSN